MDKIEFADDDNLDSPKVRAMSKELHNIKMERVEREKIDSLDEEIYDERAKLRNRKIIDKIPTPVKRGAKWVGKSAKGVAAALSKIEVRNTSPQRPSVPKVSSRSVRSVDRGPSPSFSNVLGGINSFSNSLGGVASARPRRSSKPHNPFGMVNNFSSSLNRDLLNNSPTKPVTKRKRKAKKKTVQTKYIILR